MKTGLSLEDLARKITAQRELKRDYIADTGRLTMEVDGDRKTGLFLQAQGTFPILPLAHDQIGTHLKIPAAYYDRMAAETPDLLATNVNRWFREHPEKRMLRTLGGDTRAYLSNKYRRVENEQIAEACLPVLMDLPGVQIPSCEVTDRRLYIHFVVPTVQGEVKKGDIVQAGGIISNSEVGCGRYAVAGLAWRLICLNGMKTGEEFGRNHVGRRVEDSEELWAEDTVKADDNAIMLKMRDMVRAVVDQTRFQVMLAKMQGLTEGEVTGDPGKAVEVLAQKIGATEVEQGGILRALIKGGDLSRWGIVNAVTAQAHDAKNYDRAVEFESMGGALLDLPATEWKRVLEAA